MKRTVFGIGTVFFFLCMLIAPGAAFNGASSGLLLWFQVVLPTLFPFLVLTNILLATGNIRYISSAVGGVVSRLFRVSGNGSFAVVVGFLCGYPMGAKTAADMVFSGLISQDEGKYLLSFCNNTSPVFIMNYLVLKAMGREELMLPTLVILLISPAAVSIFTRRKYLKGGGCFENLGTAGRQSGSLSVQLIDACIMDSFETLVKVGGYIILFSVLLSLCQSLPMELPYAQAVLSTLEVTNGISLLRNLDIPFLIQYPLLLGLTAFGGLCAAAQTQCMIEKAGLPFFPYLAQKLAAAAAASFSGYVYLQLF